MKIINALLILGFLVNPVLGSGRSFVKQRVQNEVVVQQKVIKFDDFSQLRVVAVPVSNLGLQYYYEAEPLRRNDNLSDEDIDKIVSGVVEGILDQIQVTGEGEPDPQGPGTSPEGPEPQNSPVGEQPSTLDEKVLSLFNNKCLVCHDTTSHKGKLVLVGDDGKLSKFTDGQVAKILRRTTGGFNLPQNKRMPLNSDALEDTEVQTLIDWQDARLNKPVVAEVSEEPKEE